MLGIWGVDEASFAGPLLQAQLDAPPHEHSTKGNLYTYIHIDRVGKEYKKFGWLQFDSNQNIAILCEINNSQDLWIGCNKQNIDIYG